jgi:uncharacterized protein YukE
MSGGTLAPHAYDWVGGDMAGLQALQGECAKVASAITAADRALSGQVSQVVGAGGWQGSAAGAFSSAWDQDSSAGAQLAGAWNQIGSVAGNLAVNLASLENALEGVAAQAEAAGLAIDTADGSALPNSTGPNSTGNGLACPSPQLISQYTTYRTKVLAQASVARAEAALALDQLTGGLLPSQPDVGDVVNGLDGVRGLWAVPTTYRREVEDDLAEAAENYVAARKAAMLELIAKRKLAGNNARLDPDTKENLSGTAEERAGLEGKLADAPPESILSQAADGDAAGLGLTGVTAGALRAVPFIGATVGAGVTVWQDREAGESWGHSLADGAVSNGAAFGAGLGVAALVGTGSAIAVAGGVVLGGAAAVGVGDFVHNLFQENWSAQIQAHGVVGGVLDGVGNAATETGHQAVHLLDDIGSLF